MELEWVRKTGYKFLLQIKNRKSFGSCSCSCSSSIYKQINWKYKNFYSDSRFKPFFAYITFVGGSTRRRLAGPRTGRIRHWQGLEVDLVGVPVILSGPGNGRQATAGGGEQVQEQQHVRDEKRVGALGLALW